MRYVWKRPSEIGFAEVRAGETTWVDFRGKPGRCSVTPVVLGPQGPMAGICVILFNRRAWTGDDGSVRFDRDSRLAASGRTIEILVDGVRHDVELPMEATEIDHWSGEVQLPREELSLTTLDSEGQPCAATLKIWGPKLSADAFDVDTSGTGKLTQLPAGEYGALTTFVDGSTRRFEFTVPGEPVTMQAYASGTLRISIIDVEGRPLVGKYVSAGTWLGEGAPPDTLNDFYVNSNNAEGQSDEAGEALLRGVCAGHVWVQLQSFAFIGSQGPLAFDLRFELAVGEEREATMQLRR